MTPFVEFLWILFGGFVYVMIGVGVTRWLDYTPGVNDCAFLIVLTWPITLVVAAFLFIEDVFRRLLK